MKEPTFEMRFIKDRMKEAWSAGDFGVIAKLNVHEANAFIDRLGIEPGAKVLDVACGTGNLAIPAARIGARVTGLDLVPNLIRQAYDRAKAENLKVNFDVGDAESLPYEGNEFDYVVTMFGAMFCPRPDVLLSELLRVCKPGGTIAMANWTPEGFVGEFFKLGASYLPPPASVASPVSWGNESTVMDRFGSRVKDLFLNRRVMQQRFDMPPHQVADHFIRYFGPSHKIHETLDIESRLNFRTDLMILFHKNNVSPDDNVIIDAEYLEVRATKI